MYYGCLKNKLTLLKIAPTPGLGQGELSIEPPFLGKARLEISVSKTPREEAESTFRGTEPPARLCGHLIRQASPLGCDSPVRRWRAAASEFLTRP